MRFKPKVFVCVLAIAVLEQSADAINNGQVDAANEYANVGAIVVDTDAVGVIEFCSGTLIDDKAFLTAGHCTDLLGLLGPQLGFDIDDIYVSFDPADALTPATWHGVASKSTHPDFSLSGPRRNDVGMLILDQAVGITPAELAPVGFLDDLSDSGALSRRNRAEFTVIGYGSIRLFPEPVFLAPDGQRRFATSEFQNLRANHLQLNMVQAPGIDNGGTSFGDSGGPAFWEENGTRLLTSVTSWGDAQAVATDMRERIDTASAAAYINGELAALSLKSVAPIPEPAALTLACVGMLAMGLFRVRRRHG